MGHRWHVLPSLTVLSLGMATSLAAQESPTQPDAPAVLQIGIESVRSGRSGPHTALEQRWAATFRHAGVPVYWLGATSVTGPNEFWWFTGMDAIADLEAQDKAVEGVPGLSGASDLLSHADAENVESSRSILARLRPDLSRLGGVAVARARYFNVITWRVRPGQNRMFEDAAKLYSTIMTEARGSGNWATYEVVSGMPAPTYLVFSPMRSIGELDPGPDFEAIMRAMTPARQKQFNDMASAGYISVTSMVLRLQPQMSYMPAEFAAQDSAFWAVRP